MVDANEGGGSFYLIDKEQENAFIKFDAATKQCTRVERDTLSISSENFVRVGDEYYLTNTCGGKFTKLSGFAEGNVV